MQDVKYGIPFDTRQTRVGHSSCIVTNGHLWSAKLFLRTQIPRPTCSIILSLHIRTHILRPTRSLIISLHIRTQIGKCVSMAYHSSLRIQKAVVIVIVWLILRPVCKGIVSPSPLPPTQTWCLSGEWSQLLFLMQIKFLIICESSAISQNVFSFLKIFLSPFQYAYHVTYAFIHIYIFTILQFATYLQIWGAQGKN